MLMNGKEVNHLIIGGEQFDKSYVGKKIKAISPEGHWMVYYTNIINVDGSYPHSNTFIDVGDTFVILAKYKNMIFVANPMDDSAKNNTNPTKGVGYGWIPIDHAKFID